MKKKRAPFPPIEWTEAPRLPREPSHGADHQSGRCLIALEFCGKYRRALKRGQVLVRNCYYRGSDPCVVENMREFTGGALYTGRQGVSLSRLVKKRFHVVQPPFMVIEPIHNCMAEMPRAEFDHWFATHRDTSKTAQEARAFQPEDTPMLRLLKMHWRKHQVHENWTPDRIRRLCALWNMTPYELAELIQWAPGHMDFHLNENAGFINLPGPVAVWFYFLENFRFGVSVLPGGEANEEQKAS